MTALPPALLIYLAIGLGVLLLIIWRAPQVIRPPAGSRVMQAFFVAGLVVGTAAFWPWPLAVACREACRILRASSPS